MNPIRTLLAFLFAAGSLPAWSLQYDLPTGRKLIYRTVNTTDYGKGKSINTRDLEIMVTARNPDGSWQLLLRETSTFVRIAGDGKETADEPEIDWARCRLFPDGRIEPGDKLGLADIFIPLPKDTLAAKSGWDRATNDGKVSYRVDNKTLGDSLWVVRVGSKTPLDEVYEISRQGRLRLDTRRGLPVGCNITGTQGYGNRRFGTASRLKGIDQLDPDWLGRTAAALAEWFVAESTCNQLGELADDDPTAASHRAVEFDSTLRVAQVRVADSAVRVLYDRLLADCAQLVKLSVPSALDSLKGTPAPDWSLTDLDGLPYALKVLQGRVVVLDFWYRGCPWCIRAMPQINQVARDFASEPVQVLGMNIDKDTADARFVINKLELAYPTLLARGIPEKYKVQGYPTMFVIDPQGIIRAIHVGYAKDIGARLSRSIRALLPAKAGDK